MTHHARCRKWPLIRKWRVTCFCGWRWDFRPLVDQADGDLMARYHEEWMAKREAT